MIIDLFIPCYIDQFYPDTAHQTVKILERLGVGVNYNVEQTCCGKPAFEDGYWDACKEVGEKFIREFQNERYIVCPGPGCVNTIRDYYQSIFHNSSLHNEYKLVQKHVHELADFLVNVMNVSDIGARYKAKAAYLNSCACMDSQEPGALLLSKVRELELVEITGGLPCCGMTGGLDRHNEEFAIAMADVVLEKVQEAGCEVIVSNDYNCLMHLQGVISKRQLSLRCVHLAEVLASGWE
jgi:L-lactate dehydrogenase complex protein LldE